jgi:demethylmenaquinone methyltransferase / 2-methoxy-6-polyprenyl-1,4-benzoquinol methylase
MQTKVKPDMNSEMSKKAQVEEMFDSISGKYDFLNRFLSLGIDQGWRKKAIQAISTIDPKRILDVATGTADLAIAASKGTKPEKVIGVDISEGMMKHGRVKIKQKGLHNLITLERGDSEKLPFEDNSFDAVTVGFGVRNFENLELGLQEIHRVTRSGGKIAILEFSKPRIFPIKQLYNFYFKTILPTWGRLISGSQKAYTYLPESVQAFPDGKEFTDILEKVGFTKTESQPLTFGICSLYTAIK